VTSSVAQAERFVALLCGISDSPRLRAIEAARQLKMRPPSEALATIDEVLQQASDGTAAARVTLRAIGHALFFDLSLTHNLRAALAPDDKRSVSFLLADEEAAQTFDLDAARRADAKLFTVSLGHLRSTARMTAKPEELSRIATCSNPLVMRELLQNTRITEPLVIRIAARRPARPEPLFELWNHPEWSNRLGVLRALVLNPYAPVALGHRIVPLLHRSDWRELAGANELASSIRLHAAHWCDVSERALSVTST
jgi:hypothetical protein